MIFRIPRTVAVAAGTWMVAAGLLVYVSAASSDAEAGRQLFEKRCTGCHSLEKNKEGPRLRGVYGRKAGSVPDFSYSDALKNAKITWDAGSLDAWLENPEGILRDNDMAFHVSSSKEREQIIEFLRLSSGK